MEGADLKQACGFISADVWDEAYKLQRIVHYTGASGLCDIASWDGQVSASSAQLASASSAMFASASSEQRVASMRQCMAALGWARRGAALVCGHKVVRRGRRVERVLQEADLGVLVRLVGLRRRTARALEVLGSAALKINGEKRLDPH
jgi:hypothetical protein